MTARAVSQFYNLIEVADTLRNYPDYYFFIKSFAFTKGYSVLPKSYSGVSDEVREDYEKKREEFRVEKSQAQFKNLNKSEYVDFLESYFSNVDFDTADLKSIEKCQDLTELLACFGNYEDLWLRRIDFFNQKIVQLTPAQDTSQNRPLSQNTNQQVNQPQQVNTTTPNTNTSTNSQNSKNQQMYVQPSRSVEDMNLPEVRDGSSMDNTQFSTMNTDYIPRLVDKSIKTPISKNSSVYARVKGLIKEHMEYSGLELDFHKLELAKDHIETAIYYLRNIRD